MKRKSCEFSMLHERGGKWHHHYFIIVKCGDAPLTRLLFGADIDSASVHSPRTAAFALSAAQYVRPALSVLVWFPF